MANGTLRLPQINRYECSGYVATEPDLRYLSSGKAVLGFNVAVSKKWKDRETNEQQERTMFIHVKVWNNYAEAVATIIEKGSPVLVIGELAQEDDWADDQEQKRKGRTHVNVNGFGASVQRLDWPDKSSRPSAAGRSRQGSDRYDGKKDDIPF